MSNPIPTGVFGLHDTLRFIESAAVMHAISEGTQLEWQTYDDSTALNLAYLLLPWKDKPGFADVRTPSRARVEERSRFYYREFSDRWLERLDRGPQQVKDYLQSLERIRALDFDRVSALFNDARAINKAVDQELKTAIRTFAGIKLAGTLAVAGLGAGLAIGVGGTTALIAGGISAGYSITGVIIKEWHQIPMAKVMGVSKESGKWAAGEGLGRGAAALGDRAYARAAQHQEVVAKSEKEIDRLGKKAADSARERVKRRTGRKIAEKEAQKETAEQGVRQATKFGRAGRVAGVGIPVVFALWDSIEGVMDFKETWDETADKPKK